MYWIFVRGFKGSIVGPFESRQSANRHIRHLIEAGFGLTSLRIVTFAEMTRLAVAFHITEVVLPAVPGDALQCSCN